MNQEFVEPDHSCGALAKAQQQLASVEASERWRQQVQALMNEERARASRAEAVNEKILVAIKDMIEHEHTYFGPWPEYDKLKSLYYNRDKI